MLMQAVGLGIGLSLVWADNTGASSKKSTATTPPASPIVSSTIAPDTTPNMTSAPSDHSRATADYAETPVGRVGENYQTIPGADRFPQTAMAIANLQAARQELVNATANDTVGKYRQVIGEIDRTLASLRGAIRPEPRPGESRSESRY